MRYKGKHITFVNPDTGKYDRADPNCEGRVTRYDGKKKVVYVTNLNMPYLGTFINKPVPLDNILEV